MVSMVLIAGLSHGMLSRLAVHTDCHTQLPVQPSTMVNPAEPTDVKMADLATTELETAQQSEVQDFSFTDRIINLFDTFAKLVMVI